MTSNAVGSEPDDFQAGDQADADELVELHADDLDQAGDQAGDLDQADALRSPSIPKGGPTSLH